MAACGVTHSGSLKVCTVDPRSTAPMITDRPESTKLVCVGIDQSQVESRCLVLREAGFNVRGCRPSDLKDLIGSRIDLVVTSSYCLKEMSAGSRPWPSLAAARFWLLRLSLRRVS